MKSFKVHIAIFFLAGFLFPQGSSALHYLVVAHGNYNSGQKFTVTKSYNFEYHSCIYHLNGCSPSILSKSDGEKLIIDNIQGMDIKFCCLKNYVHQPDYNFLLRGPPVAMNFSQ